jgi:hypothetical protein
VIRRRQRSDLDLVADLIVAGLSEHSAEWMVMTWAAMGGHEFVVQRNRKQITLTKQGRVKVKRLRR